MEKWKHKKSHSCIGHKRTFSISAAPFCLFSLLRAVAVFIVKKMFPFEDGEFEVNSDTFGKNWEKGSIRWVW